MLKSPAKATGLACRSMRFFKNRNDEPALLMEAASWWIEVHELDHFEKAVKIKAMVLTGD